MNAWLHVGYTSHYICWVVLLIHQFLRFLHTNTYPTTTSPPLTRSGSDKGVYILTFVADA